ncbi:MAG: outer membrane beta-barrel protein [Deltaproteobacteria bacterium]|nr:outer membrane beta-barrel protein [Deltaproteobacteria bacterium]
MALAMLLVRPAVASESGLPLGPLVAKPGVNVSAIFDTNVYRDATNPQPDFGLWVKPYFGIVYPGDDFRFTLDTYYRFFTYFNLGGTNHNVFRRVTDFGVAAGIDAGRRSKVGFSTNPEVFNAPATRGFGDGTEQNLGANVPIGLHFRPTKAFQINVNARWNWNRAYFSPVLVTLNPVQLGNRHELAGGAGLDWKFFPRSHLLFEGEFGRIMWGRVDGGQSASSQQDPAWFWRVWFGIKGDITRKLSLLAQVGYGGVYFDPAAATPSLTGPEGILGRVEFAIRPVTTQRLAFGFSRDYTFAYYASRIENTQAYFKYQGLFFQRLSANFDFSWNYRNLAGHTTRTEHQWTAGLGLDIMVAEFFHVEAGYRFSAVNPSSTDVGEYIDNTVTLGFTLGFK